MLEREPIRPLSRSKGRAKTHNRSELGELMCGNDYSFRLLDKLRTRRLKCP